MSTPTIYYFNGRGRAECSRTMMTYFGTSFNDDRFETVPRPEVAAKSQYGQFPHYEDENLSISQTQAIEYYLADKYKLLGSSPVDTARILSYVLSTTDVFLSYFTNMATGTLEKFRSDEGALKFIRVWEKVLKENGNNHLYGDKLSWADFSIFTAIDYLTYLKEGAIFEAFPAVLAFHKYMYELPQINEYLKSRSTTTRF